MKMRDQVEAYLNKQHIQPKSISYAMLLIEEIGMLILEKNKKKQTMMECTVLIKEKVQVIFRDDGEIFDVTDADGEVNSLRSYVVANMMTETFDSKYHLVTTSFNRNKFELEK